jgi:malonate decarboxylase epsilon subunit
MLAQLRDDPIAAATLNEAQKILGRNPSELDSVTALAGTQATQLALLIAGVASARRLEHHGIAPAYVAGHSVGAFAAAVHAHALRFADALRLVQLRGGAMAQAHPQGFGMAAIAGVSEQTLQLWIDAAKSHGTTLYPANRNAPDQFTVSGADADLAALITHARTHGARAVRLAVATPSHSPLMAAVAAQMQDAIQSIPMYGPRMPYVANHTARVLVDLRAIGADLAQGVAHPVLWHEATCALYERDVRVFVEMPPGDTLTRLAQAAFPDARALALDTAGLPGLRALTHR